MLLEWTTIGLHPAPKLNTEESLKLQTEWHSPWTRGICRFNLCLGKVCDFSRSKRVTKANATAFCLKDRDSSLDSSLKFLSTTPRFHFPNESLPWTTPWGSGVDRSFRVSIDAGEASWIRITKVRNLTFARRNTQPPSQVLFSSRSNPSAWPDTKFLFLQTTVGPIHEAYSVD